MRNRDLICVCAGLVLALSGSPARAQKAPPVQPKDILSTLEALKYDLLKSQKQDGSWEETTWFSASPISVGGQTALATWALLQAGQDPFSDPIHKSVQYLLGLEMSGTYNRSLRCMVLASLARIDPAGKYAAAMQRDVDFLLSSRLGNGRWTYAPANLTKNSRLSTPDMGAIGDNSNTQFAILALREAAVAGAKVPASFWREARDYWHSSQNEDGGFEYRDPAKASYGSMTGAGTASLFISEDMIRGGQCCVGELPEPISRALGWLSENFSATSNPRRGEYWLYWMYSAERVAETSGYRYFGEHDWFWEGSSAIIDAHRNNRLNDFPAAALSGPSFGLIFLAKSVAPVVCNKLQFGEGWNPNPLDATHVVRYLSTDVFERHLNWQIVRLDAPLAMFHEAPILLITTKTWPAADDPLLADLKARIQPFCESGGTVLIDHTCRPDKDFARHFRGFLEELWPGRELRPLPANHPVYTAHFSPESRTPLQGLGNGCREYVILSEGNTNSDLSCVWQKAQASQQPAAFQMGANLFMYATDKAFRNKLEPRSLMPRSSSAGSRTLPVARLQHKNNANACPLALPMLSQVLVAKADLGLSVSDIKFDSASLLGTRVLVISGQGKIDWTNDQIQAVRQFINSGGAVLGEALMGDADFAQSLRRLAAGATMVAPRPILDSDSLISGKFHRNAFSLAKVQYSRALRWKKGVAGPATLEGCRTGNRWSFLLSPYDLTNGLTTARPYGVLGYEPDDASRVAANCMLYFAETTRGGAAAASN